MLDDKAFEATKERVRRSVERWVKPLGLRMWQRISVHYHRDSLEMEIASRDRDNPVSFDPDRIQEVAGRTRARWEYLEADIHFNLASLTENSDEEIDYLVRHEMAHILVNEMREWADTDSKSRIYHEERVCTRLAQIFDWCRELAVEEKQENATVEAKSDV